MANRCFRRGLKQINRWPDQYATNAGDRRYLITGADRRRGCPLTEKGAKR
jgi:hypothetical protein